MWSESDQQLIQVKNNLGKNKQTTPQKPRTTHNLKAAAAGAKKECNPSHRLSRVSPEPTIAERIDCHGVCDLQPGQTAVHKPVLSQGHDRHWQQQVLNRKTEIPILWLWDVKAWTQSDKPEIEMDIAWVQVFHCCHTSTIQIGEVQTCCFKLVFQPSLNLHFRHFFPKAEFSKTGALIPICTFYFRLRYGRNCLHQEISSKHSYTTIEEDIPKAEYSLAQSNPSPIKMKHRFSFNKWFLSTEWPHVLPSSGLLYMLTTYFSVNTTKLLPAYNMVFSMTFSDSYLLTTAQMNCGIYCTFSEIGRQYYPAGQSVRISKPIPYL